MIKMNKKLITCLLILVSIGFACKKKTDVPSTAVDVYLNLQLGSYIMLQTPLNWIYYSAGNRGLIIYRRGGNDFTVLERTCTYDPANSTAIVQVLPDNFTCVDSTCSSRFSIADGSVINGPATQPLIQYQYDFDGTTLHIYN